MANKYKPKITPHQLTLAVSVIGDIYHQLTLDLFDQVVDRITERGTASLEENPYIWQLEKMANMGLLNQDNLKLIAERADVPLKMLEDIVVNEGYGTYKRIKGDLADGLQLDIPMENNAVFERLESYVNQAKGDLDNLINTTLPKSVQKTYKGIIEQTVAEVVIGASTADKALKKTVMKWHEKGFDGFTDSAGRKWRADSYARTVIQTTTYRAYNEARTAPAKELGVDTFYYSINPTAREMCAPLQAQIVTTGQARMEGGEKILALSDYGHGSPSGCLGINCSHTLTPFLPGINKKPTLPPHLANLTPEQAIENANKQAKQRALEREIRRNKERLHVAEKLGDQELVQKYQLKGKTLDSAMKDWVGKHSFLHRDKVREKAANHLEANYKNALPKDEYKRLEKRHQKYLEVLGEKEAPKTVDELIKMKYNNRREYELLSDYYKSRKSNMISAFSSFEDFVRYKKLVDTQVIGKKTSDGVLIKSQSDHFIERLLGTTEDPKTKRPRSGVEVGMVVDALVNGRVSPSLSDPDVNVYYGEHAKVTLNTTTGNLIQVAPQGRGKRKEK